MTDARDRPTLPVEDLGGMFPRVFPDEYVLMEEGDGARVWDAAGNEYIDAVSSNQNVNIGHGVTEVARAAREQLEQLEYVGMSFVNRPAIDFTSNVVEFTPDGFEHVWLVSGGSLANESAVKMARQYHLERGNERKYKVISRSMSYHGNTIGAMSWSGHPAYMSDMEPLSVHSPKIPSGTPYRCEFCDGDGGAECGRRCANELERTILECGPENVAAFITEPLAGSINAGAYPHEGYFERIREICDEYDVLFIADEILTGFGRTGENFAMEHFDVTPDIITAGKGMTGGYAPMGATIPHDSVVEVFRSLEEGFAHGHTYTFNPSAAAIGASVLDYTQRHDVVQNAQKVGAYLRNRLEELYEYDWVGDVRGKGMMYGVEFVGDRETKEPLEQTGGKFQGTLTEAGLDNGVILMPEGFNVNGTEGDQMIVAPPLTVEEPLVDEMMSRIHATFDQVENDLDI